MFGSYAQERSFVYDFSLEVYNLTLEIIKIMANGYFELGDLMFINMGDALACEMQLGVNVEFRAEFAWQYCKWKFKVAYL
jgi:hypothetical protein